MKQRIVDFFRYRAEHWIRRFQTRLGFSLTEKQSHMLDELKQMQKELEQDKTKKDSEKE